VTSCQKDAQEDNYRQCLTVRHRYCTNLQSDASSLHFFCLCTPGLCGLNTCSQSTFFI